MADHSDATKYHALVLRSAEGGKRVVATLDDRLPSSPLALVAQETEPSQGSDRDVQDLMSAPYMRSAYIPAEQAQIFTRSIAIAAASAGRRGGESPPPPAHYSASAHAHSVGSLPLVRASGGRSTQSTATLLSAMRMGSSVGPQGRSSSAADSTASFPKGLSRGGSSAALLARNAALHTSEPKPTYLKRVQEQAR